ncbi:hypothetical protein [Phycobacter sp. K97]
MSDSLGYEVHVCAGPRAAFAVITSVHGGTKHDAKVLVVKRDGVAG